MNKDRNYFIVLFILSITNILLYLTFELKVYMWGIATLVWWIWVKEQFTDKTWFPKKIIKTPKPIPVPIENQKSLDEIISELPKLNALEKEGYIQLTKLCCSIETQNKLIHFFENLKDFSNDEVYLTTLNYVMEYFDKSDIFFIMSLDWKQDIETLEWRIESSLQNNFNLAVKLPDLNNYPERVSVSFDNVFEDFDRPLREIDKQIGFIDTESDEYVIVIHNCSDKKEIIKAVNKIGYNYNER